ncbi:helix-turn-helix transcriptional regulator [uncultured Wocania sp.]|uniref:helix-turn-helix transcriptional regulator n=1 Tax=uncultured Wocania sp. TaxID=2834404 RepID=UPI0030F6B21F
MNTPYTSDKKILQIIDILKSNKRIRFDSDFCEAIGVLRQTLSKIKNGEKHFTPLHIETVIKVFKVNANWIFGISDEIFLDEKFKLKNTKILEHKYPKTNKLRTNQPAKNEQTY